MFTRPTDYGVGETDGRGSNSYLKRQQALDIKQAQEVKGWNGRKPMAIPWKLIVGAGLVYYFFIKK